MVSGRRTDQGGHGRGALLGALALALLASVIWASLTGADPPSRSAAPSGQAPSTAAADAAPATPHDGDADEAINAFNDAFYVEASGRGSYRASTSSSRPAVFWRTAEMLEMVEDAYVRSHRPVYRHMIVALHRGIVARFGRLWTGRRFNDDIMWMVIASVRAYDITGRRAYLDMARRNFDRTYARAWSGDLDGGLWWTTDRDEKNACVNSPGAIAAALLYKRLGQRSYLAKAKRLYGWVRTHLYEADQGRVNDHLSPAPGGAVVDYGIYTYNQGTFVGAADLLYRITGRTVYRDDALKAIAFARSSLTSDGVLRDEGAGSDGGGFKGIFIRYAVPFTRRQRISGFEDWYRLNASAVWSNRTRAGLMEHDWSSRDLSADLSAFDASSGVVLLQYVGR